MSPLEQKPALAELQRSRALDEINRTIRFAEIRCISFEELLQRVERLQDDPYALEIVHRIVTEAFSHNELHALSEVARRLANVADASPAARKRTLDGSIGRILSRMPQDIAAPIAAEWLGHKRKARRLIAYKVLRISGVPPDYGPRLLNEFIRNGDQEYLQLIVRNPDALIRTGAEKVLLLLDDEYWRMRAVEAAYRDDMSCADTLSSLYPREFAWAVGRLKSGAAIPALKRLFEQKSDSLEFVSIYAWALGQIGATEDLMRLKRTLQDN